MADNNNFAGHETFHCRPFWLKKGYDFLEQKGRFNDENAVAYLGVGKNMVTSIRFWMTAFGMAKESQATDLAHKLLADDGWDPYLEDIGSLWLLHYHLVKEQHNTIARIIFKELRDRSPEFNVHHYTSFVSNEGIKANPKTLERDFGTFLRNYRDKEGDELDDLSGLLADLQLVGMTKVEAKDEADRKARKVYYIERKKRTSLPSAILIYAILDSIPDQLSFSLPVLMDEVGKTFALDRDGMLELLQDVEKKYKGITLSRVAGVYELQFKMRPEPMNVLAYYYEV
jgi:hypothetical protein